MTYLANLSYVHVRKLPPVVLCSPFFSSQYSCSTNKQFSRFLPAEYCMYIHVFWHVFLLLSSVVARHDFVNLVFWRMYIAMSTAAWKITPLGTSEQCNMKPASSYPSFDLPVHLIVPNTAFHALVFSAHKP